MPCLSDLARFFPWHQGFTVTKKDHKFTINSSLSQLTYILHDTDRNYPNYTTYRAVYSDAVIIVLPLVRFEFYHHTQVHPRDKTTLLCKLVWDAE